MSIRNAIALFLALTGLLFLFGCGSSSPKATPPPSGSFSDSDLNGTYVFSSAGADNAGGFLTMAGTLVADGKGGISGGTVDVVGVDAPPSSPAAQPVSGGSYSVTLDGRGQATLNTNSSLGTIILDFVLTSNTHGSVTEFDGNGSGSGTIDLQSTVAQSQLAGSFGFSLGGVDASNNPIASVGSFTLDSSGTITAGIQDFNDNGFALTALPIATGGSALLGSGTGPGTITLNSTTFVLKFDFYPIDATHLKFIETDFGSIVSGDVFTQTGAVIPSGPMVFTVGGSGSSGPIAAGGLMTSDGSGNITGGLEDVNNAGTVSPAQLPFSGTYAPSGSVGGRNLLNLSGFTPAIQFAIYPSSGGVLMLETDSTAITSGAAFAQTSTSLSAPQGYGFNVSASNSGNGLSGPFEEDDIAEFTASSGNLTGLIDVNDEGTTGFDQRISGNYVADSINDGRGQITTTFVNGLYYVVDGSSLLFLETDGNQVGLGAFGLQMPSSAQPAMMLAHFARVRPKGSARTAWRHK